MIMMIMIIITIIIIIIINVILKRRSNSSLSPNNKAFLQVFHWDVIYPSHKLSSLWDTWRHRGKQREVEGTIFKFILFCFAFQAVFW